MYVASQAKERSRYERGCKRARGSTRAVRKAIFPSFRLNGISFTRDSEKWPENLTRGNFGKWEDDSPANRIATITHLFKVHATPREVSLGLSFPANSAKPQRESDPVKSPAALQQQRGGVCLTIHASLAGPTHYQHFWLSHSSFRKFLVSEHTLPLATSCQNSNNACLCGSARVGTLPRHCEIEAFNRIPFCRSIEAVLTHTLLWKTGC